MVKKIIVVYDYGHINGGAAKVAIRSAVALSKANYEVHYFTACGPVCDELDQSDVSVKCLFLDDINQGSRIGAICNGIWNRYAQTQFRTYLKSFDPTETIVHFHGWTKALSSSVVKTAQDNGFCCVITLHDYFVLCPNGGLYDYQKQRICTINPMSAQCMVCNCDKRSFAQKLWRVARQLVQDQMIRSNPKLNYISISDKNEKLVKSYVAGTKFYRVENPVQYAKTANTDRRESDIYLFVGRVSDEKGVDLFCKAISKVQQIYKIQGIVIGDGPCLNELQSKYETIQFAGWKKAEEVYSYLNQARCLVMPSKWYEGAPLTIVEALSANLPCIVSDCTSATELIIDGENGFVFKTNNENSLVQKIEETLDDELLLRIQNTIDKTFDRNRFTDDTHVCTLIKAYENALLGARSLEAVVER